MGKRPSKNHGQSGELSLVETEHWSAGVRDPRTVRRD